jgi:hypothetical protein
MSNEFLEQTNNKPTPLMTTNGPTYLYNEQSLTFVELRNPTVRAKSEKKKKKCQTVVQVKNYENAFVYLRMSLVDCTIAI